MNMKFWKFWTVSVLIVFALLIGHQYFGLVNFILMHDQTYITFVNIALLIFAHMMMLKRHFSKQYGADHNKMISYIGDTTVALGLVGTLIGFMIVLWSVFGPGVIIDPSDVATMTGIIAHMSQGMAAALVTSLSGIVASIIINLQLVFLEE